MPIVLVRSLTPPGGADQALRRIPPALATALGCDAADVWAYWERVDAAWVAGRSAGWEGHCPVVSVLAREREDARVEAGMAAVARAVAEGLGVPIEDVWLHWETLPARRVYAGGGVR